MRIISKTLILPIVVALLACSQKTLDYTQFVNPFVGTGEHGHTYPGAVVPHGLVQLSPDTRINGWDACAGYHYDDSSLLGFSHTHLSGTGIGDLGDFLFLPYAGELQKVAPNGEDRTERYGSAFSHSNEKAEPGYYQVFLDTYNINVELTAAKHAGYHKYTFPQAEKAGLYIDLTTAMHSRRTVASELKAIDDKELQGWKRVQGWAPDRYIYFYARFSEKFTFEPIEENRIATLLFDKTAKGKEIYVKVGISFVDCEGAKKNLDADIADKSFDDVRKQAHDAWNSELAKIEIETADETDKTIFYTALYHTSLEPVVSSDVDGRYRTMENNIMQKEGYVNYSIFSLWDTFRALHPLYTIVSPADNAAMIRALLTKYEEGGLLPMWELCNNYTGCMIGYHSVPVIVDAYLKGELSEFSDADIEKLYEACKKSSSYDTINVSSTINRHILHNALMPIGKSFKDSIGYIPADIESKSVARGLEYAYNDWLIALFAQKLGKSADYDRFMKLAKNYSNYYDASTGFMRGKMKDGKWKTPFDPFHSEHNNDPYCEGNAWQWTWFVPHDVDGLAELMGGRDKFILKLDSLFSISSEVTGENASADISGLIGQYAHGNEPSHQTIHLYNQIEQGYKTQSLVDSVLHTLYFNAPKGLSGNEDCGEMSAWYVLNSMGFYSYCPGIPAYSIGRPLFDNVKIKLSNGKVFEITVINNSKTNKYVASAKLNGAVLDKLFFSHDDLMKGGTLEITMQAQPSIKE